MLSRFGEFLTFEAAWKALETLANNFLRLYPENFFSPIYLSGAIFISATWFILIKINKNRFFAFPITDKILEIFHVNTPDFFPALRSTTLKKHIALVAAHCPLKSSIKRIYLFEGTPFRYQLVVIGKTATDIQGLGKYWEREAPDLFEEHFAEIYREKPKVTFRYHAGSFWSDWNVLVVESLKEVPDNLALKKYKWLLYK
jgi:hypothetical protein